MKITPKMAKASVAVGRLSTVFAQAKVLHSAVEVGLFDLLAETGATAAEIRDRLGLHPRLLGDFLDALVALELVEHVDGLYRNSGSARECLVTGSPVYLGDTIRATSAKHYRLWGELTEVLRDGKPRGAGGPEAFTRLYADPAAARKFLSHMDSAHATIGPQLGEFVEWGRYKSFVDVGGARGSVAADLVERHPHLTGVVFELPPVGPLFDEHVAARGVRDRVGFHAGDFFRDPLPETDVVILGHVLHDWAAEDRQRLLERAFAAVRPGGAVVVYDQMLDDERPDLPSVLGSLQVALVTGGSEYTVSDCRARVEKAGFRYAAGRRITSIGNDYVLVAEKDR